MANDIILPNHMKNKKIASQMEAIEKQLTNAYQYIVALERFVISYSNPELMGPQDLEFLQTMAEKYRPEEEDVPVNPN